MESDNLWLERGRPRRREDRQVPGYYQTCVFTGLVMGAVTTLFLTWVFAAIPPEPVVLRHPLVWLLGLIVYLVVLVLVFFVVGWVLSFIYPLPPSNYKSEDSLSLIGGWALVSTFMFLFIMAIGCSRYLSVTGFWW